MSEQLTVLFLHTGVGWGAQDQHLLEAVAPKPARVVHAWPKGTVRGATDLSAQDSLLYDPRQGIAGALGELLSSGHRPLAGLLALSEQLMGPLADLGDACDEAGLGKVRILVRPDSRADVAETATLAQPELAGELALELPWLRVGPQVASSGKFRAAVHRAATSSAADLGWLDFAGLVVALEQAGLEVLTSVKPSGDLFARSLSTLVAAGLPFVPWRLFTMDPLELDRWAVVPRPVFDFVMASPYPRKLLWDRILRSCPPQTWYTNLALLSIFGKQPPVDFVNHLRTAIIAHVFYPEMLTEILERAGNWPDPVELFVTTDSEQKREQIETALQDQPRFGRWQVRVVTTNRGRDISAFLIDCEDVIRDPRFDLVMKIHSKQSLQDPESVSGWFRRHLFENLLGSPGYSANVAKLFQDDPQLGIVMPPVIHMGVPTMGNGWTLNREPAKKLAGRLGVEIPFDEVTPLSPYGSMFIARREALVPLVDAKFSVDEFPDSSGYRDGSTAHALERLFSYVVFSQGFYGRCVQTAELAEISAVDLQYKHDRISHYLFPFASRQIELLEADNPSELTGRQLRSLVQRRLSKRYPRAGEAALSIWMAAKRLLPR